MAQPTFTFDTYDAIGIREDLSDIIYDISPTDTPFLSMAARDKATNTFTEWQTDSLASIDTGNAVIEGDDATLDETLPTTRLGNYTQISDKTLVLSGTEEEVNKAGRRSELAYQLAKRGRELKRDMEAIMTQNQGYTVGSDVIARTTRSLESFYATNDDRGATGADGTPTTGATDGTQRPFTESQLKNVIQLCWTAGGNPTYVMVGPKNKQVASGFTGGATRFDKSEDKRLTAAVDVYISDFGELRIIPNRFSRDRTAHVLDMEYWSVKYLRPFRQWPLSKTGDSEKRQLLVEYALCAKQEAASGVVADLTVT